MLMRLDKYEQLTGKPSTTKCNEDVLELLIAPGRLEILIGRSQEAHMHINHSHVSKKHTSISVTDEGYLVKDLGSKNGTFMYPGIRITKDIHVPSGRSLSFGTQEVAYTLLRSLDLRDNIDSSRIPTRVHRSNTSPILRSTTKKRDDGKREMSA